MGEEGESISLPADTSTTEAVSGDSKSEKSSKPDFGARFVKPKIDVLSSAANQENDLSAKSKKGKQIGTPSQDKKAEAPKSAPAPKPEVKVEAPKEIQKELPKEAVEKPPETQKHKVKINGIEREVTTDQLIRDYQLREASNERFQKASELDKRNQALLAKAKSKEGIGELLQAFGHDPRALAEEYLADVLNFEMLTPEQKRIKQLEFQVAQSTEAEKQKLAEQNRSKEDQVTKHHAEVLQKSIIETLEMGGLPKTTEAIRKMTRHMRVFYESGIPVNPADVVDLVKEEIANENRALLSQMGPEQIAEYLGKEKLDEYRQWELSKLKNPVQPPKEPIQNEATPRNQKRHYRTMEEFKESQRRAGIRR